MRSSQKSGRGRGKNNNRNKNNNRDSHSPNRVYESAGPEGKVRGTPQQIIDKYQALARDYQLSGDRVMAENFLQHAEHYTRILVAAQEAQAERQAQQQANQAHQNAGGGQQPQQGGQNAGRGQQNGAAQAADPSDALSSDQPPADGLAAIDAAQGGAPDIVETPENTQKSQAPSRPRRPRPKPKADAEATEEPSPEKAASEAD